MIPIRLRLTGFLSYLDTVDLDFTSFDLACISGSNGAGKSSLLDAMTWALFGQARRRDDALINAHAQAAEVVFDYRYEGDLYRVQRSKPRDKSTLLEFFICTPDGAWRPLTEKTMRETEARIQSSLRMDYETFTNASFLLQGRADQFAQQRPGDRKRVLSAILGLETWEEYRAEAVERRKEVEGDLRSLDAQMEDIDSELKQETTRKQRLQDAEARLGQLAELRQARESGLAAMQRQAAILAEQQRMVEMLARAAHEARQRYERSQDALAGLCAERDRHLEVMNGEAEVLAFYQRWQDLRAELARWDSVAENFREIEARRQAPLTAITAEASRLDEERRILFKQEIAVLQDEDRLPALELQLAQVTTSITQIEQQLAGRTALDAELQSTQVRAAEAQAENKTLRESMRALKERIDKLNQVEGAICPLCGQQLSAYERVQLIAGLEVEGKTMGNLYRANQEFQSQAEGRVRDAQARIAGLARYEQELREAVRKHDQLAADRQRTLEAGETWRAGGAARLAEINRMLNEADFAHEARRVLAEIDTESRALGYDTAAHDAVKREELQGRASEAQMRRLDVARASLVPLERQISGLQEQLSRETAHLAEQETAYQQALSRYEDEAARLPDVNKAERELYDLQTEENRLRMEVGMYRQAVAVLDTLRERYARLSGQREGLTQRIARYKSLERAFSKDGVPALLIEQALPEIETQANDILDRLSNGGMSVRFETQRQYKDKNRDDRRETLDIIISDAAGEREYELFSGGEAFRVNFAIRLALSRVLAQRAGARLQTLVIDEGFGSQDMDGRQRLIEAINMVRPEFAKVLVITHMEELKEAFPARIEVEKTPRGSRVQVIT